MFITVYSIKTGFNIQSSIKKKTKKKNDLPTKTLKSENMTKICVYNLSISQQAKLVQTRADFRKENQRKQHPGSTANLAEGTIRKKENL